MYLLNWCEETGLVEASLGGRVTYQEIEALGDEVGMILAHVNSSCEILLDYGKAQPFEAPIYSVLAEVKDRWLDSGAERITSVPQTDTDMGIEMTMRIQTVLEGREDYIRDIASFRINEREHAVTRAA